MNEIKLKPVIAWSGDKTRLLKRIIPLVPNFDGVFFEPFIGGGAVLLSLKPKNAVISDINPDIINMWKQIKRNYKQLSILLTSYKVNKKTWDKMNSDFPNIKKTSTKRASYFMHLISYVYMGIYLLDKEGKFKNDFIIGTNRTSDKYNTKMLKNIENISHYLNRNNIKIKQGSYEKILDNVNKDDFVYLDPPYPSVAKSKINYETQFDNMKFCNFFNKLKCKKMMSNLKCDIITNNIYKKLTIKNINIKVPYGLNKKNKHEHNKINNVRKEIIVVNF
jgi:DNA adenine methylase